MKIYTNMNSYISIKEILKPSHRNVFWQLIENIKGNLPIAEKQATPLSSFYDASIKLLSKPNKNKKQKSLFSMKIDLKILNNY